jgi:predicted DNA-binding transcriptional regulator YafY
MSRHLERLLQIDLLLRSQQRQTAVSLAQALEVSDRTIRNDIAFLRNRYHAPIEFHKAKGFYYTDPDWRLPSISLSQGELFALTLGARMLQAYAGSAYQAELQGAIARLAERLPEQTWIDLQQLAEQNVLFRVGAELDLDPEVWQLLEQACQQKQRLWMRYYSPTSNEISERELDPYVLHFSRNNPYVTGFCHLRQEVRWFRVDRIQKLELRSHKFEIDPMFDRANLPLMPKGVEHKPSSMMRWLPNDANLPLMPKGVEHYVSRIRQHAHRRTNLPLMPKGVEHSQFLHKKRPFRRRIYL